MFDFFFQADIYQNGHTIPMTRSTRAPAEGLVAVEPRARAWRRPRGDASSHAVPSTCAVAPRAAAGIVLSGAALQVERLDMLRDGRMHVCAVRQLRAVLQRG